MRSGRDAVGARAQAPRPRYRTRLVRVPRPREHTGDVGVYVSALELFSIGIGPSSSHTVGPMRAARRFVDALREDGLVDEITHVTCVLCGSLAATGVGHGTPDAVVAGLTGLEPETCDPDEVHGAWAAATERGTLSLAESATVSFDAADITFEPRTRMPEHPNALILRAYTCDRSAHDRGAFAAFEQTWFSIGGGFVRLKGEPESADGSIRADGPIRAEGHDRADGPNRADDSIGAEGPIRGDDPIRGTLRRHAAQMTRVSAQTAADGDGGDGAGAARDEAGGDEAGGDEAGADGWGYSNAAELLALCARDGLDMCDIAWRAELRERDDAEVTAGLDAIWHAMHDSIERGLVTSVHELPGGLHVPRRAAAMRERLESAPADLPDLAAEWMRAFALAVNEENAAGGRVVTAPTNGAAGILPAILEYHLRFNPRATDSDARRFLLTAAAVGGILKANASISGAEGGCQAEVGSACAMAAAGLCAVLGGTPPQVENAAEIAVEHHLGLTCDPVGGLVQIPCIERNAIAASTAVSAARLALNGDGRHIVPLDIAIETMRQTGADMSDRYKETSAAGLAVNVVEC